MEMAQYDSAGRTDIGQVRPTNQDQFLVADLNKSMVIHSTTLPVAEDTEFHGSLRAQLLLVADGMGGRAGGNVASQIGVGTTARYVLNTMPWFFSLSHDREDDQRQELLAAMAVSEDAVEHYGEEHPELDGMGTTLTMAYLVWPRMYVVHIGDSRCYLLREGRLTQLTNDHTMAQELVDSGAIQPEDAHRSPLSHVLVHSIGHGPDAFRPEVSRTMLVPGDRVLLCTDGLSNRVPDDRIAELLGRAATADAASEALVAAANQAGGDDNITVVVSICHPPIERPEP